MPMSARTKTPRLRMVGGGVCPKRHDAVSVGVLAAPRPDIEEQVGHLILVRRAVHRPEKERHNTHAPRPPSQ